MTAKDRKAALLAHLKRAILTQDLRPGADLDEVALCAAFDLSRTPVREAFRDLEGQGYVELRENRGARVAGMGHTTLRDFFLAAPMIYAAVLRLAARNATPAQIDGLRAAQAAFVAALRTGSTAERALANNRFHEVTGEMAANVYLMPSFKRLLIDHARISMTFYRPRPAAMSESLRTARAQHEAMIAAIEAGDEERAAALADEHWALSRGEIESYVMPAPLDAALGDAAGTRSAGGAA